MSVENIVEQYLNEGLTEEYKVLMNVLMDKLELGEITFHEYQEFSANWRDWRKKSSTQSSCWSMRRLRKMMRPMMQ